MFRSKHTKSIRAFTLIELMISIAIVVVLMVGITKVFSITANTAGATNQIASGIRDARAAQTIFYNDLNQTASDMPFMILRCGTQAAFRSKADKLSDRDGNPLTIDLDGDNNEGDSPGETSTASSVNNRNHRVDVFSFFDHGFFQRQTGNQDPGGAYVANMSSNDAWIWYGHLRLLNNRGTRYFDPGDTTTPTTANANDNNQYASDWALGREVILLKAPSGGRIADTSSGSTIYQYYMTQTLNQQFGYSGGTFGAAATADYSPFQRRSTITRDGLTADGTLTTQSSRYDLAGTTISQMSQQVSKYLSYLSTADPTRAWWTTLMTGDPVTVGTAFPSCRFQAQTYINAVSPNVNPINPDSLAYTAPLFVQHCSQFIVEYAGDYLQQDANPASPTYGQVENVYSPIDSADNIKPATDGQTDFVVTWNDTNGNGVIDSAAELASVRRSIRWYGLPRDTQGNGYINGAGGNQTVNQITDVVPLRDVIEAGGLTTISTVPTTLKTAMRNCVGLPFEKLTNFTPAPLPNPTLIVRANYAAAMRPTEYYECVWGPSDPKPTMIRITMTIDDPSGKLPDGQTFQYLIQLH